MIDLKATYGDTFRITLDESAKSPGTSREDKLWCYRIPCRRGHIFVHGENTLGAYCDRRLIRKRLAALPGVRVHQDGDRETTVTFDPALLPKVAELLQARRRVRLSPEERQRRSDQIRAVVARSREKAALAAPDASAGEGVGRLDVPA